MRRETSFDRSATPPLPYTPSASMQQLTPSSGSGPRGNASSDFGIFVATRIRPFNNKELSEHAQSQRELNRDPDEAPTCIMDVARDLKNMTLLDPTKEFAERATFTFDHIFSAFAPTVELYSPGASRRNSLLDSSQGAVDGGGDPQEASERAQAEIYDILGAPIVRSAWEGYNGCIFAYGQTSSGKTYTMMGNKRDPGIIPRLCRDLFDRIEQDEIKQQEAAGMDSAGGRGGGYDESDEPDYPTTPGVLSGKSPAKEGVPRLPSPPLGKRPRGRKLIKVTVSYMEIYNEQMRDLLKTRPKGQKLQYKSRFDSRELDAEEYQSLRVRQHPLNGPFVEGITTVEVENWLECVKVIRQGNEVRSSCSTDMNDSSSRSHAIFQMTITQTEALGARVRGKEVTNHKVSKINLVDLAGSERITKTNVTGKHLAEANCINQSLSTLRKVIDALVSRKKSGGSQTMVIPYRESMLTWILSDNFGGNSKTVMCANVSPHYSNSQETESTLRYATVARGIVNRVRVNEDPSTKLIRELQVQLKVLQEELTKGPQQHRVHELEEQIEENRRAMGELHNREEGMRRLITESRQREEKLLNDVESHQKGEAHWKREAIRLAKEKELLKKALTDIAQSNPDIMSQSKHKENFWMLDDTPDAVLSAQETSRFDDETACPPQGRRKIGAGGSSSFRKSFTGSFSGTDGGSPLPTTSAQTKASSPVVKDPSRNSLLEEILQTDERQQAGNGTSSTSGLSPALRRRRMNDAGPSAAGESQPPDVPRHGRRAMTEESNSRDRSGLEPQTEGRMLNSAGAGSGAGASSGLSPASRLPPRLRAQPAGPLPPSLAHLAGLGAGPPEGPRGAGRASPSTSSYVTPTTTPVKEGPPQAGTPPVASPLAADSLDKFLAGGSEPAQAPAKRIPPWRQRQQQRLQQEQQRTATPTE
jgi:hypothetical protein